MTKNLPNRCPHLDCAVAHTGGCNCDMSLSCPICRQEQMDQKSKNKDCPICSIDIPIMTVDPAILRWHKRGHVYPVKKMSKEECEMLKSINNKLNFRAWDGKEWRYTNLFLSHDGKLWYRYDGRKLKEVDWKLQFNY